MSTPKRARRTTGAPVAGTAPPPVAAVAAAVRLRESAEFVAGPGGIAAEAARAAGAGAAGDGGAEEAAVPANPFGEWNLMNREEWGKHLRADYRHDGYLEPNPPYNIGGTSAVMRLNAAGTQTKEYCDQEFLDQMVKQFTNNPEFRRREEGVIKFKFSETTGEFTPFPTLNAIGNERVGIVMDAGANITAELGAQNVITFGMCIDAASSPVSPQRRPVYYDPGEGNRHVYIDLEQFGFAPEVIRGIWIADLSEDGSRVKSAWVVGSNYSPPPGADYRVIDPMGEPAPIATLRAENFRDFGSIPVAGLRVKQINVLAGAYAGRRAATTAREQIGKTLGDTMIVASAMPRFPGPIENPFNGVNKAAANWKGFGGNPLPPDFVVPAVLAVKTGDVLNAARAVAVGVPVILERYGANGNRAIREFDYWKSSFDLGTIRAEIPASYDRMVTMVATRYEELRRAFIGITDLTPDGVRILQSGVTRFTGKEKYSLKADRGHFIKAGQLIEDILEKLTTIQNAVARYFTTRVGEITPAMTPELILARYTADLELLKNLCPQTNRIRDERGNLYPIIVITQAGPGAVVPDMEIRLGSAYQAIASTPREGDPPNYAETVYFRRFLEPVSRIAGGGAGGVGGARQIGGADGDGGAAAAEPVSSELDDYVDDIIGESGAAVAPVAAGAGEAPLRFEFRNFDDDGRESIPANATPLIDEFTEYYVSRGGPLKEQSHILAILFDLFVNRNSPRIANPRLLERIKEELDYLKEARVVSYDEVEDRFQRESSISTLMYNAFNAFINKENAMERERDEEIGFGYLERKFTDEVVRRLNEAIDRLTAPISQPTLTLLAGDSEPADAPAPALPASPAPAPPPSPSPAPAPAPSPAPPPGPPAPATPARVLTSETSGAYDKLVSQGIMWSGLNTKGEPLGTVVGSPTPPRSSASTPARGGPTPGRFGDGGVGMRLFGSPPRGPVPSRRLDGGTPRRRKNRKTTYRLKKKPSK